MARGRRLRITEAQAALMPKGQRPGPMPASEKQFQAEIRKLAAANGWLCYHTLDSRGSDAGWPDLVLLRDGVLIIAELKTERGVLTTMQGKWLGELRKVKGVKVEVWRPSDGAEIRRILTA